MKYKIILILIFNLSLLANSLNTISQNKTSLIKELFIVKHNKEIAHKATKDMLDSQIKLNNLGDKEQKALYKFYEKYMAYKYFEPKMIELYAKAYTEQDIKDMIKFYKTSAGQKIIIYDAEIAKEITKYSINRGRFYQKELQAMIKDEYNIKNKQLTGMVLSGTTYFSVNAVTNNNDKHIEKKTNTKYELGIYSTKTKDKKLALRKYIDIKKNGIKPDKIIRLTKQNLYFSDEINTQIIKSKDGMVNYPKLYNDEYIIIKVISNPNKETQQSKKLTLVKENHAVVSKNNIKYIIDSYIILI